MFTKNDRKMLDCTKNYIEYLRLLSVSDDDYLQKKFALFDKNAE